MKLSRISGIRRVIHIPGPTTGAAGPHERAGEGNVNRLGLEMPDSGKPGNSRSLNRRELLKLSPLLAVGVFAIPRIRDSLLTAGVSFTDWASAKWFRRNHLAPTFDDREVAPLEKFYVNTYDVDDPEVEDRKSVV